MAKIYKITNIINGKSYIGKTERTIEERFQEHIKEKDKKRAENRPLYRAINKYGIANFEIKLIEETNKPEEREIYYIKYFDTFNNKKGYNATVGGDGKKWLDYEAIIECYKKEQNITKVAEIMNCHYDTVRYILKNNNILTITSGEQTRKKTGKKINQYSLNGDYIATYDSTGQAATILCGNRKKNSHIGTCARGERKTAYGFKWEYID